MTIPPPPPPFHSEPPPIPSEARRISQRALVWGLVIGLLPALSAVVVASFVFSDSYNGKSALIPVLFCFLTMACCSISSILLFKNFKTGWALAGAVFLLVINIGLTVFFGCSALLFS